MSTTDKEYLEKFRNYADEARMFLSNKMKPERERSVCRAFLRTLGIPFKDSEVIASADEPVDVDVIFREAQFQVTELEPDHRRGDDWKEKQRKYESAISIDEAIETEFPPIPVSVDLIALIPEVISASTKKANHYVTCKDLDLLIYVDWRKRFLAAGSAVPDVDPLKAQGWRSVSLLFPPYAVVLFAKPEAPNFLKAAEAKLHTKWFDIW